jgi:hypothetical protein
MVIFAMPSVIMLSIIVAGLEPSISGSVVKCCITCITTAGLVLIKGGLKDVDCKELLSVDKKPIKVNLVLKCFEIVLLL